jgi:hypothetical protein
MPILSINGIQTNINPTTSEQGTYQKHGLGPNDRKQNDYLRMVARTFSTFRNTPARETVVTYINGFGITVNEVDIPGEYPTDPNVISNIFKIEAGVCMVDNQLIDIFEDTYFVFSNTDFIPDTKYGIVIEYDYIEQRQDNIAKIRFIDYASLHFPRIEDSNVVSCDFNDKSLDGNNSTTVFSGKPGLLIATFATSSDIIDDENTEARQIIQSNPATPGAIVNGIDPQYLSKLYIQNYKLLFEYFGNQSRAIYSSMGLTSANFIAVAEEQLHKASDPQFSEEEDLRSGDMCYFDDESGTYKRSVASRQKFSQVIGMYLNEYNEGNHLIYTGGYITLDAVKYNLPPDHQLLTMVPGTHYFLEDATSLFESQNQIRTIDNYVLSDSSGRISNRYYPSSVRVGYATACNQIVLNIDHSAEIGTQNLISLFGTYDEYQREYEANESVINATIEINTLQERNIKLQNKVADTTIRVGDNNAPEVNAFFFNYSNPLYSYEFTYLMYNILVKYFAEGFNSKNIIDTDLGLDFIDMGTFSTGQQLDIKTNVLGFNNLKNIRNMINESIADIEILLQAKETELSNFIASFKVSGTTNQFDILTLELQIARYKLGDDYNNIDNFENYQLINNDIFNYDSGVGSVVDIAGDNITTISDSQLVAKESYFTQVTEINKLKAMLEEMNLYNAGIDILIDRETEQNIIDTIELGDNSAAIDLAETTKDLAAGNIMNADSNKLDIFQMDDYQRVIFNYTYITDRLQKRLILVNRLNSDLIKAQTLYEAVQNNEQSTIIEQVSALGEVNRIENYVTANNTFISNYTTEYNKIRAEYFPNISPIIEGDINFDDGGYANQKIGTYRYGCDDFETTYGGLATNLISSPCGPYTSPDGFIVSKNSGAQFIDVMVNDGHGTGDTISMYSVNNANHGTSILSTRFLFEPTILDDIDLENYVLNDGVQNIPFVVENNKLFTMIPGNVDMSAYTLLNSLGGATSGVITITGGVSYIPDTEYAGPDIFGYSITDTEGKIGFGTITVEVTGPYTVPDNYVVSVSSANNILNPLSNDGHTGNEEIVIMSVTQPAHGTISFTQGIMGQVPAVPGEIVYEPTLGYTGNDTFDYYITDGTISIGTGTDGADESDGSVVKGKVDIIVQ